MAAVAASPPVGVAHSRPDKCPRCFARSGACPLHSRFRVRYAVAVVVLLTACEGVIPSPTADPGAGPDAGLPQVSQVFDETAYLFDVPHGDAQMTAHCDGAPDDRISRAFCGAGSAGRPVLHSLAELQDLLDLHVGAGGAKFAITTNSASLVATGVSAVNPRTVLFKTIQDPGTQTPGFEILTFTRGEPFVELATLDVSPADQTSHLAFYLVVLDLPCRHGGPACTYADLVTPSIESSWTSAVLYEDNELSNTTLDCLQCHKRAGGPDADTFLRMQERTAPFTHWLSSTTPGGQTLLADFHAAHGAGEAYGPIPGANIDDSDPAALALLVKPFPQPHPFDSAKIESEVLASAPAQPAMNVPAGTSATWRGLYDLAAAGQIIPPPYHDVKITDAPKLAAYTDAYQQVVAGTLGRDQIPDPRDLLLSQARVDLGFALPDTQTDGAQILVQACQQCHNPEQDQLGNRAKFDVTKLGTMTAGEKATAVSRMGLPGTDPHAMPPRRFRALTPAQVVAATAALQ